MIDPNSFDARWTLGLGVPVIAWLGCCRPGGGSQRGCPKRIQDVRVEMARHPQDPYQALWRRLIAEEEAGKEEAQKEVKAGRL